MEECMCCFELFESNVELTSPCCIQPVCSQCLSDWHGNCPNCLIETAPECKLDTNQYIIQKLVKIGDEYRNRSNKSNLDQILNNATQVYFQITDFYYQHDQAPDEDIKISNIKNIQLYIETIQQLIDVAKGNLMLIDRMPAITSAEVMARILHRVELNTKRKIPVQPEYNHGMYQWLQHPINIKTHGETLVIIDKHGFGHKNRTIMYDKVRLWINSEFSVTLVDDATNDDSIVNLSYYDGISIISYTLFYGKQYCKITQNGIEHKLATINGYYIPLGDKIMSLHYISGNCSIIKLLDLKGKIIKHRTITDVNFNIIFNGEEISTLVNNQAIYFHNQVRDLVVFIDSQNLNHEILELHPKYKNCEILYLDHKRDIIVIIDQVVIKICSLTNPNIRFDTFIKTPAQIPYIVDEKLYLVE